MGAGTIILGYFFLLLWIRWLFGIEYAVIFSLAHIVTGVAAIAHEISNIYRIFKEAPKSRELLEKLTQ